MVRDKWSKFKKMPPHSRIHKGSGKCVIANSKYNRVIPISLGMVCSARTLCEPLIYSSSRDSEYMEASKSLRSKVMNA